MLKIKEIRKFLSIMPYLLTALTAAAPRAYNRGSSAPAFSGSRPKLRPARQLETRRLDAPVAA